MLIIFVSILFTVVMNVMTPVFQNGINMNVFRREVAVVMVVTVVLLMEVYQVVNTNIKIQQSQVVIHTLREVFVTTMVLVNAQRMVGIVIMILVI